MIRTVGRVRFLQHLVAQLLGIQFGALRQIVIGKTKDAQREYCRIRCTGLAEQASTAAEGASAGQKASAKRFVSTGKKLCEAGNERAAAKQFRAALKIAGVAELEGDSQVASR